METEKRKAKRNGFARINPQQHGINEWFDKIRWSGKDRGHSFSISKEEAYAIGSQPCNYCGKLEIEDAAKTQYIRNCKRYGVVIDWDFANAKELLCNGLDRVDNLIGYEITNVVSCCKQCNTAKMAYTEMEFLNWIEAVYNKRIKHRGN